METADVARKAVNAARRAVYIVRLPRVEETTATMAASMIGTSSVLLGSCERIHHPRNAKNNAIVAISVNRPAMLILARIDAIPCIAERQHHPARASDFDFKKHAIGG